MSVDAFWAWPDAVLAGVLAVGLSATAALLVSRFAAPGRRATAVGPAVAAALVVAMACVLLTHGEPFARAVVGAVVLVGVVVAAALRPRPRRTPPERERSADHNEIATPDRRC